MRVLFLGSDNSPVRRFLDACEDLTHTSDPIESVDAEFIVSHGYRHILPPALCQAFDGRSINLHVSYLPWNRGADPNLWSHIDGTPKGVTIHYMAPGLDRGDIIAQRMVSFSDDDTLASSYEKLQEEMFQLFVQWWPAIKAGTCPRVKQEGDGSYHRSKDKDAVAHLFPAGWNTRLTDLRDHLRSGIRMAAAPATATTS